MNNKPSNMMLSQEDCYSNDKHINVNNHGEDDDIYERVQLYNDSYESYLKNADNFINL